MTSRAFTVPILHRDELLLGHRAIESGMADGSLVRVRPGNYVRGADAAGFTSEEREIVRARAWGLAAHTPPTFSHATAAALHGLPLFGAPSERTHVIVPDERPGAPRGLIRHRGDLRDDEVVEIGGLRCTSLARTMADVARTAPFLTAICVADAALRAVSHRGPGDVDLDEASHLRAAASAIAARSAHGRRRAEAVIPLADGRAQLPGESVSRMHLRALGFAPPRLQVAVPDPYGGSYWLDFALDDVDAFGEFDGAVKYHDPALRGGLTSAEVLDREKQREDWIRGTTHRRLARWTFAHLRTPLTLAARLDAFGIRPPR